MKYYPTNWGYHFSWEVHCCRQAFSILSTKTFFSYFNCIYIVDLIYLYNIFTIIFFISNKINSVIVQFNILLQQSYFSISNKIILTKCNRAVKNWFDKRYSLLNWSTNCYSKVIHRCYWNWSTSVTQIDPQALLKLIHKRYSNWPTNITQIDPQHYSNLPTNATQIDPQTLFKLTHKDYSNWPTNVTQNYLELIKINPQVLLKIFLQTLLKINFKDVTKLKNLLAKTAQLKLSKNQNKTLVNLKNIFIIYLNLMTFFFFYKLLSTISRFFKKIMERQRWVLYFRVVFNQSA